MRNRIPIAIGPGVVTDNTVTAINTGNWSDASLVRWWSGLPQMIGGWETNTVDTVSGKARGLFAWRDRLGLLNIAIGTHTNLYVWQDGTIYDITPEDETLLLEDGGDLLAEDSSTTTLLESSFTPGNENGLGGLGYGVGPYGLGDYGEPTTNDSFPLTWTFDSYGQNLIANPRGGAIYRWTNDVAAPAERLPNAPTQVYAISVSDTSRQILAYGCNEESTDLFNPRAIRWCDIESPNSWTTTATNNAGEQILDGNGRLIRTIKTAQGAFIWSETELFFQQYIGDPAVTFRFTRQSANAGLVGPNAVAMLGQTAYWITPSLDFLAAPIGGEPQRLVCPVQREFEDNLAAVQQEKIFAGSISKYGEIWWFYPDSRDGLECSRAIHFSTLGQGWGKHVLARTAFLDAAPSEYPVGVDASGLVYWHERGRTANGGLINAFIQSGDIRLAEGGQTMLVRGLWPDFDDQQGVVNLSIKTKAYPQASYATYGPYSLLTTSQKVDFMASGRFMAVRLESNSGPGFWRLSPLNFEGTQRGAR